MPHSTQKVPPYCQFYHWPLWPRGFHQEHPVPRLWVQSHLPLPQNSFFPFFSAPPTTVLHFAIGFCPSRRVPHFHIFTIISPLLRISLYFSLPNLCHPGDHNLPQFISIGPTYSQLYHGPLWPSGLHHRQPAPRLRAQPYLPPPQN